MEPGNAARMTVTLELPTTEELFEGWLENWLRDKGKMPLEDPDIALLQEEVNRLRHQPQAVLTELSHGAMLSSLAEAFLPYADVLEPWPGPEPGTLQIWLDGAILYRIVVRGPQGITVTMSCIPAVEEIFRELINDVKRYFLEQPTVDQQVQSSDSPTKDRGEIATPGPMAMQQTTIELSWEGQLARSNLTAREREVAVMLKNGMTPQEIARELKLSEGRVRNVFTAIMEKSPGLLEYKREDVAIAMRKRTRRGVQGGAGEET